MINKKEIKYKYEKPQCCQEIKNCDCKEDPKFIHRYMNKETALIILKEKRMYFSNPENWEDKNDSHSVLKYKEYNNSNELGILCFTTSNERHHYWNTYQEKSCCIRLELKFENLRLENFKKGYIKYRCIGCPNLKDNFSVNELPFLKRIPYIDEEEYRIIATENNQYITINSEDILSISISPYIKEEASELFKKELKDIDPTIKSSQSTLNRNKIWNANIDFLFSHHCTQNST